MLMLDNHTYCEMIPTIELGGILITSHIIVDVLTFKKKHI